MSTKPIRERIDRLMSGPPDAVVKEVPPVVTGQGDFERGYTPSVGGGGVGILMASIVILAAIAWWKLC